jgi:hypothetical protein
VKPVSVATRTGCARGEFAVRIGGGKMAIFCHVNSETDGDADLVVATINREPEKDPESEDEDV